MSRYLASRIAQSFAVLVGTLVLVFVLLYVAVDPVRSAFPVGTPQTTLDAFRSAHGLNDPLLVQLARFIWHAIRGNFGHSLILGGDAMSNVLHRLPATLQLAVPASLIGSTIGVGFGTLSARRPHSPVSRIVDVLSYLLISLAEFWVALMLILVVSVHLRWLPTGGYEPKPRVLILPILVMSIRPFAHMYQLTRATMAAEYGKQYVMALRAKGLTEGAVGRRHVLRNAAAPVLALGFYNFAAVFGGSVVVVEVVFAWPGIGRLAVSAAGHGDVYQVTACVALAAAATLLLNLVADLLTFSLDARTRSIVKDVRS